MKKRVTGAFPSRGNILKILLAMKLLIFFLCAGLMQVSARMYSQTTNISFSFEKTELQTVIREIQKQTEYVFFYSPDDVSGIMVEKISVENASLEKTLERCLHGTSLEFEIVHKAVVLKKTTPPMPRVKVNLSPAGEQQPQSRELSGSVRDNKGMALPGVTVVVRGTTLGTVTDGEGNFRLNVPLTASTLAFSFVGMKPQDMPIGNQAVFNIVMEEEAFGLDEVVAIGYGTQKKISVTGAIVSVEGESLVRSPNASVLNSLSGRVSGFTAVQYTGRPGSEDPAIFIRGVGSLTSAASTPLMLVDGVERPFSQLDPNEIESISLLKDASATAVYGIRGANGVLIVTTKRGTEGAPKISFSASTGFQVPTRMIEITDSYQYALKHNAAILGDNPNGQVKFTDEAIKAFKNGGNLIYPNTDWVDYLAKPFSMQEQGNLNISGGTKSVKYFVSLGYLNQDGMFKNFETEYSYTFGYQRYNYRANVDVDVTESTKFVLTIGGRSERRQEPGGKADNMDVFRDLVWAVPYSGMMYEGKRILTGTTYLDAADLKDGLNAVGWGTGYNRAVSNIMNVDIGLNQKLDFITEGLAWRIKVSNDNVSRHSKLRETSKATYEPLYKCDVDPTAVGDSTIVFRKNGSDSLLGYSESSSHSRSWYMESAFSYDRSFGNHHLTGLVLYNQSKRFYPSVYRDIPTGYVGLATRATYNYRLKYMVDFNLGYNGSENFAKGKRFGLFPAASFGWVITEEKFLNNKYSFLDYLKLRYSYGVVGNDKQGNNRFLYMPDGWALDTDGYNFGTIISTDQRIASELKIGNPVVTWERARKQNAGVDVKVFDGKLGFSADYFYEYRNNILTTRNTIPNLLSIDLPAVNIGEVENQGYELEMKWNDRRNNLNYYIGANLSFARNKILFMDEVPPNEPYLWRTGNSVNARFGYVFDGFWTEQDVARLAEFPDHSYLPKPGDARYKDLNNDMIIDSDDQQIIGFPDYPEYTFALSYGFDFKGFDFNMLWSGATNVSRVYSNTLRVPFGNVGNRSLVKWLADNSWTPETASTALAPRITFTGANNNTRQSDLWIRDASYLRLKNVEIGYSISPALTRRMGISRMRIYANGYNMITFDKLKYFDPEASGQDLDYPLIKVVNLGLSVVF